MTTPCVQVKLELGHRATFKKKQTEEGYTHDWTIFVRGPEGCNIQNFVEKVVFHLHESFPKPKRVLKEPPYQVDECGYAGFTLPVDIYFKNKEEPRRISFKYDLFLNGLGTPSVNHIRCEKLTFQNPVEEFRRRLIKSGGIEITQHNESVKDQPGNSLNNDTKESKHHSSSHTHNNAPSSLSSHTSSKSKLHHQNSLGSATMGGKSDNKPHNVPQTAPPTTFTSLFGAPIIKTEAMQKPSQKSDLKEKNRSPDSQTSKTSTDSKKSAVKRSSDSPHHDSSKKKRKEERDKDKHRDRDRDKDRRKEKSHKHHKDRRSDKDKISDRDKDRARKSEKERQLKEKVDKERRAEKDRREKERKAEKERQEKERLEKERVEKERLHKEKAEKEKIQKEKAEKERAEKERLLKEKAERERAQKEKAEKEKAERERIHREKVEREEKERVQKEKIEKEKLLKEKAEKAKIEKAKVEKERLEKQKAEKERIEKQKAEKERLEKQKAEKARLAKEEENKAKEQKRRKEKRPSSERKSKDMHGSKEEKYTSRGDKHSNREEKQRDSHRDHGKKRESHGKKTHDEGREEKSKHRLSQSSSQESRSKHRLSKEPHVTESPPIGSQKHDRKSSETKMRNDKKHKLNPEESKMKSPEKKQRKQPATFSLGSFMKECTTGSGSDVDPFDDPPIKAVEVKPTKRKSKKHDRHFRDLPLATPVHTMISPVRSATSDSDGSSSSSLSSDSDNESNDEVKSVSSNDDRASSVYSAGSRANSQPHSPFSSPAHSRASSPAHSEANSSARSRTSSESSVKSNDSSNSSSAGSDNSDTSDSEMEAENHEPSAETKQSTAGTRKPDGDGVEVVTRRQSLEDTQEQLHNVLAEMTMTNRDIDHEMQMLSPLMSPQPSVIIPHSTTSPHKPLSATTSPQDHLQGRLPPTPEPQKQVASKTISRQPYKATEKQDDFVLLQELHARIMQTRDIELIKQVVMLIEDTGLYNLGDTSFDFDLCSLDQITVRKLLHFMQVRAN